MEDSHSSSSSDQAKSIAILTQDVKAALANAVKRANNLPKRNSGFELCASYPAYSKFMEAQREKLISLIRRISKSAGYRICIPSKVKDVDEYVERIIGANDAILERALTSIDECSRNFGPESSSGVRTVKEVSESTQRFSSSSVPKMFLKNFGLPSSSTSLPVKKKPQVLYSIPVDNSTKPFDLSPKIKHNSMEAMKSHLRILDIDSGHEFTKKIDEETAAHPYHRELIHFEVPPAQLESRQVTALKSIKETPLVFVDDIAKLKELRDVLNSVEEFAVDLEHHTLRSYYGLTCLIQISTRDSDYIVDPFPLWNDIWILNEAFSNPKILKVFHGSDQDIRWLQRDFRIYVVNMFDTYFAMSELNTAKRSLQYLVQEVCGVHLDKKLRLADWTIRPLPQPLIDYARCDSHYLLHCYDNLREKLLLLESTVYLQRVYRDSTSVCSCLYKKCEFNPDDYVTLLHGRRTMDSRQLYALKALWQWRDSLARSEDESCNYVLPNHMMLQIAEVLPREMQGIISCCRPVPSLIKQELTTVYQIICAAREQPLEKSSFVSSSSKKIDHQFSRMTKTNSLLRSHLDFTSIRYDEEIGSVLRLHKGCLSAHSTSVNKQEVAQKEYGINTPVCESNEKIEEIVDMITTKMDEWAAPYECYSIALKEEAQNAAKLIEKSGVEKNNNKAEDRKKWSHLDPAVVRADIAEEVSVEISSSNPEELAKSELDESMLTKTARRKLNKRKRKAVDISMEKPSVSSSQTAEVKRCKISWMDAPQTVSSSVDYESLSRDLINASAKRTDSGRQVSYSSRYNKEQQMSKRKRFDDRKTTANRGSKRKCIKSNVCSFAKK